MDVLIPIFEKNLFFFEKNCENCHLLGIDLKVIPLVFIQMMLRHSHNEP